MTSFFANRRGNDRAGVAAQEHHPRLDARLREAFFSACPRRLLLTTQEQKCSQGARMGGTKRSVSVSVLSGTDCVRPHCTTGTCFSVPVLCVVPSAGHRRWCSPPVWRHSHRLNPTLRAVWVHIAGGSPIFVFSCKLFFHSDSRTHTPDSQACNRVGQMPGRECHPRIKQSRKNGFKPPAGRFGCKTPNPPEDR